jgi:hypothetical protein
VTLGGSIERLFQSNESMNERLPTDALNKFLRRLLGRRIYERFVEPGVIDAQQDYWPEQAAGNRWMARWVLVRAYSSILKAFVRALRSVVLLVKALV